MPCKKAMHGASSVPMSCVMCHVSCVMCHVSFHTHKLIKMTCPEQICARTSAKLWSRPRKELWSRPRKELWSRPPLETRPGRNFCISCLQKSSSLKE